MHGSCKAEGQSLLFDTLHCAVLVVQIFRGGFRMLEVPACSVQGDRCCGCSAVAISTAC